TPVTPKERPVSRPPAVAVQPPASAGDRLYVGAGPMAGRPDVYPTVTAALAKAAPGQTVTVTVPQIEEAVTINARLAGVHLESGLPDGQKVVWRPPTDPPAAVP